MRGLKADGKETGRKRAVNTHCAPDQTLYTKDQSDVAYTKVTGRSFYVYALYRDEYVTPFYIGKGCGQRWFVHEKEAARRTCRKSRVIQSMWKAGWDEIPKRKLAEHLTDEEAKALEVALIAEIGRFPNEPLVNHTDGGDGVSSLSEEARAKKSAANVNSWANPLVRQKRIAGMKAALGPPKPKPVRLPRGEAMRLRWQDPDYRAKQASHPPRKCSEETRAKMSILGRARWEDEEYRNKTTEAIKTAIAAPEHREKQLTRMADPETKARFVAAARTPEVLLKRGANMSANLNTPEGYAKRSATMQANWDRRKAAKAAEPLPLFAALGQNTDPSANDTAAHEFQVIPGPAPAVQPAEPTHRARIKSGT